MDNIKFSKGIGGNVGQPASKGIGGNVGSANNNTPQNTSSGDCFVATIAFGTPLAEEIQVLRNFRDQKLRFSTSGRRFIRFYYHKGPHAAAFVQRYPSLKKPLRGAIKFAIYLFK